MKLIAAPDHPLGADSTFDKTLNVVSSSPTGSVLGDSAIGALIGYLAAPQKKRVAFAGAGAALGGLGGTLGLCLIGVAALVLRRGGR